MATKIGATVSDPQIGALLGAASNAAFLMTILVAKHFNFGDGEDAAKGVLGVREAEHGVSRREPASSPSCRTSPSADLPPVLKWTMSVIDSITMSAPTPE